MRAPQDRDDRGEDGEPEKLHRGGLSVNRKAGDPEHEYGGEAGRATRRVGESKSLHVGGLEVNQEQADPEHECDGQGASLATWGALMRAPALNSTRFW